MARKERKYHFIYKTIDTRNENFYIGMHSTDNLNDGYIGSGDRLRKLIHKHGKDIFKMKILEFLPNRKSLKEREEEIVNSNLLKEEKCMNLKPGGYGGFNNVEHRNKFFEAAKEDASRRGKLGAKKFKEKMKDKCWEENFKSKISDGVKNYLKENNKNGLWDGRKHSEQTKKKLSKIMKKITHGSGNSQFGTMWVTDGLNNKKLPKDGKIPLGWVKGRKTKL